MKGIRMPFIAMSVPILIIKHYAIHYCKAKGLFLHSNRSYKTEVNATYYCCI